jgi:hypothetical protein
MLSGADGKNETANLRAKAQICGVKKFLGRTKRTI